MHSARLCFPTRPLWYPTKPLPPLPARLYHCSTGHRSETRSQPSSSRIPVGVSPSSNPRCTNLINKKEKRKKIRKKEINNKLNGHHFRHASYPLRFTYLLPSHPEPFFPLPLQSFISSLFYGNNQSALGIQESKYPLPKLMVGVFKAVLYPRLLSICPFTSCTFPT